MAKEAGQEANKKNECSKNFARWTRDRGREAWAEKHGQGAVTPGQGGDTEKGGGGRPVCWPPFLVSGGRDTRRPKEGQGVSWAPVDDTELASSQSWEWRHGISKEHGTRAELDFTLG